MDIFQKSITPDKPRVLAEEQIYVYVPMATSTNAGIASYNRDQFDIIGSEVSLKWPTESFAQGPIETPSIVKVLDNEFEYTGNLVDLISGNSKISSDKLEVQLKRILRDAYERPELVMLDPNYFVRTIVEKDGKQYYKYNTTAIHYNMSQTLSEYEQAQARQNISASSISDNEATNKRIDALVQTGVYSINGKTGNVVLKNSDLENDTNYATEQYVQENGGKIDKILLNNEEQEIVDKVVNLIIDKTTVGLSNVDNTSDKNKPISDAAKQALDTKIDKSGGIFTGNVGVQGNLSVSGTIVTKDTETLKVQDNVIVTNANKIELLDLSGLAINKNDTQTYGIMYDAVDDSVKLGLGSIDSDGKFTFNEGEGSPVATRSDSSSLTDNHLIKWDATNNKLVDSGYSAEDKLDKIINTDIYNRVYGINSDGTQTTYNVSVQPEKDTIVCRDYYGRIGSKTFYANYINNLEDWDTNPERRTHITLEPKSFEMVSYIGSQVSGLKFTNDTDTNSDDMSIFGEFMGSKTTPDYAKQIGFSMNYNNVSYLENGITLRVLENLQNGKILSLTQNGLFIGDGFDAIPEGEQTLPLKNKKEISPNVIRYDIEQTLTDDQKAQARANIGAGTGGGTGGGTTVTVGGVAQDTWDADSKVNKTVDTYSINIDNQGINLINSSDTAVMGTGVSSGGASLTMHTADISNYIGVSVDDNIKISSGTSEQNTLMLLQPNTMEIGHTKGDKVHKLLVNENGIGIYDMVVVDGNTLQGVVNAFTGMAAIQAFSDTSGGSIIVQPNTIEIETPKLTYNGNEVATVNQLSSTSVESVNGKTGAVVLYANDVGAVAIDDIVDNLITEDTTKVLSANQGKVLADRDAATNQQLTLANAAITAIQGDVSTLQNSVSKNTEDTTQNMADIADINKKIPTQASETNKLADKNFVNSSINNVAAFYITADANGNAFETYAQLSTATVFYSGGQVRTPTRNDYCVVRSDENHDNATTRYIYQGSQWEFQYIVNETSLTAEQLAAINSGITSALVTKLNGIENGANKITVVQSTGTSTSSVMSQNATTTELAKKFNSGYGTCSTASATSAKVVTIADTNWKLKVGTIIGVKFTNSNSASNVTLNVNNTGAKNIWYNNANYTGNSVNVCGSANRIIYYMYSGTVWVWISNSNNANTDTIPAISWTASGTAAKTASCTSYQLLAKSYFNIVMTNANTSKTALTLNVNGKGAKPIFINGTASSATNYTLPAGSYIVYYDGTNYQFRTDGNLPASISGYGNLKAINLWTNPNPTEPFEEQTVTLSTSDYNFAIVFYKESLNDSYNMYVTQWFIKGTAPSISEGLSNIGTEYSSENLARYCEYISDTSLSFTSCSYSLKNANGTIANKRLIPIRIVGFEWDI